MAKNKKLSMEEQVKYITHMYPMIKNLQFDEFMLIMSCLSDKYFRDHELDAQDAKLFLRFLDGTLIPDISKIPPEEIPDNVFPLFDNI